MRRPPRIQRERRLAHIVEPGDPGPRPRRRPNRLPQFYDDMWRRDVMDRSWKRHRKQQWKGVA